MYDDEISDENYLRGVQEADDAGLGGVHQHLPGGVRRPMAARALRGLQEPRRRDQRHQQAAHLAAGVARGRLHAVYATDGYEQSVSNLSRDLARHDKVFGDGYSLQLAKVTGSIDEGYVATLNVPV